ncbi:metallo-endopeptidase [Bacillus phage Moonbeam]|uniref:Peptidase n=1 Tax=Bacillus phage Moonbeam TaxID=1540091 RepID=A0A0A0RSR8_9CAUD|nr:metallo-endopeptidase [Bacillus phage Moonbeam]AIW03581.1 peptidase [Bacillus phage Moonbeam]
MQVRLNGNDLYRVTTQFGAKDALHPSGHTGLDLAMDLGSEIKAPANGVIEKIVDYHSQNIGKGVIMRDEQGNHLIFGHLSDNTKVHVGQHINEGDLLALSGNTGRSTGPHLHFGVKNEEGQFVNPEPYLASNDRIPQVEIPSTDGCSIYDKLDGAEIFNSTMQRFNEGLSEMTTNFIDLLLQYSLDTLGFIINLVLPF